MSTPSDQISFSCTSCATTLNVPAAMAGISGPCPICGTAVIAPHRENRVSAQPLPAQAPNSQVPAKTITPSAPGVGTPTAQILQMPSSQTLPTPTQARTTRWKPIALTAGGLGLATATWLALDSRPQEPHVSKAKDTIRSSDLVVETPGARQSKAQTGAHKVISDFLQMAGWAEAKTYITIPPDESRAAQAYDPTFLGRFRNGRLIPQNFYSLGQSGQFLSIWEAESSQGAGRMPFVVEDTTGGPRLRWDLAEQHLRGTFQQFASAPAYPATKLFVKLLPMKTAGPNGRLQVEVMTPFTGPAPQVIRAAVTSNGQLDSLIKEHLTEPKRAVVLLSKPLGLPQGYAQLDGLFTDTWAEITAPQEPEFPLPASSAAPAAALAGQPAAAPAPTPTPTSRPTPTAPRTAPQTAATALAQAVSQQPSGQSGTSATPPAASPAPVRPATNAAAIGKPPVPPVSQRTQ